jgi:hypothetical protein
MQGKGMSSIFDILSCLFDNPAWIGNDAGMVNQQLNGDGGEIAGSPIDHENAEKVCG